MTSNLLNQAQLHKALKLLLLLLLPCITGCASTKGFISPELKSLKEYRNIYVDLGSSTGSTSASTVGIASSTGSTRTTSTGHGQTYGTLNNSSYYANTNLNLNSNTANNQSSSQVNVTHTHNGNRQAQIALEKFIFKLREIGFNVVNDPRKSNAIVHLSIGEIRYDPLAGWIADQASLQFIDTKTGDTLAHYIADGRIVTPTVNKIIKKLSKKVKKDFNS